MIHTPSSPLPAPHAPSRRLRVLTALYVLFVVSLVMVADSGAHRRLFDLVQSVPCGDKVGHLVFMGTLAGLLTAAVPPLRRGPLPGLSWGSLGVGACVLAEEVSQRWFPSRTFDLLDLAADFVGIALAAAVCGRLFATRAGAAGS